jgi:hypothetical protein
MFIQHCTNGKRTFHVFEFACFKKSYVQTNWCVCNMYEKRFCGSRISTIPGIRTCDGFRLKFANTLEDCIPCINKVSVGFSVAHFRVLDLEWFFLHCPFLGGLRITAWVVYCVLQFVGKYLKFLSFTFLVIKKPGGPDSPEDLDPVLIQFGSAEHWIEP